MSDPSLIQRKSGRPFLAWVVATFVIILLLFSTFWLWTVRCDRQFASQLDEIRERGEPATLDEAEDFYALPKGAVDTTDLMVNATTVLSNSAYTKKQKVPSVGSSGNQVPAVGQPWDAMNISEGYLELHAEEIRMLHEASRLGGAARFATDFSQGPQMTVEHVTQLREGARALSLAARVHAHRGEVDKAAECLHSMISLGESLENEPILVSQVVRTALLNMAVHSTAIEIHEVAFSDAQLKELQEKFRSVSLKEGYRRAMMGERVIGIHYYNSPSSMVASNPVLKVVRQDTDEYFDLMEELVQAMDESYTAAEHRLGVVEVHVAGLRGPRHIITKMVLPGPMNLVESRVKGTAMVRMADVAIAIKRFVLAEGQLPSDLKVLAPRFLPKLPLDPFNQQPINYVPTEEGAFTLSCVGPETRGVEENVVLRVGPSEDAESGGAKSVESVDFSQ